MTPPSYPATDDTADQQPSSRMSWGARIGIAAAVLVFVLIIALHLTGVVGPGTN